jgi:hypothetical protein
MKFSLPDQWSVRLFIALCRRYGIPISAAARNDDHGQSAATLFRYRGVAAIF